VLAAVLRSRLNTAFSRMVGYSYRCFGVVCSFETSVNISQTLVPCNSQEDQVAADEDPGIRFTIGYFIFESHI
jgi:hypothetical protein